MKFILSLSGLSHKTNFNNKYRCVNVNIAKKHYPHAYETSI